jgi:arginyl-tRNA--protein-N-Asp/Glu arginylyltransferase
MKMKLSIKQRLALSSVLALQEGDSARLRLFRKAREEFSLSEEETKAVSLVVEPTANGDFAYKWDMTKDPMKECEISDLVIDVFHGYFKKLDQEKKLKDSQLEYYEMFVENKK